MLDVPGMLQSIEPTLGNLLLQLGILESQHLGTLDPDTRRRKLVKLAITALQKLASGKDTADARTKDLLGGDSSQAMSLQDLAEEDRAANALGHRMGCYVPPERR